MTKATNITPVAPSRFQKIDQALASKFLKTLGERVTLQGADATLKASDERAEQRAVEREEARMDRAADIKDFSREFVGKSVRRGVKLGGTATRSLGMVFEAVSDAFESLFNPKMTPAQKREGEKIRHSREVEAENTVNFEKYTAQLAWQQRQEENEREAARQRDRDRGGRDR